MNKNLQLTIAWFVLAFVVTLAAVWQAQVAVARDVIARNQLPPPPVKTRHAVRAAPVLFSGDPVADYVARCEKGLTDQEIGWIIEDFKSTGLNINPEMRETSPEKFLIQRIVQDCWYREALVDGLRLTPQQSAQVKAVLSRRFDDVKRELAQDNAGNRLAEGPCDGYSQQDSMGRIVPWELCSLTARQEMLTWKYWFDPNKNTNDQMSPGSSPDLLGESGAPGRPQFLLSAPAFGWGENVPEWSDELNFTLPLLNQQKFILEDRDPFALSPNNYRKIFLENVRRLHPAQLKILLLESPQKAVEIESAMNE